MTFAKSFADANTFRLRDEWHEDIGDVLWWRLPIEEPPSIGHVDDVDDDLTHWTPIVVPGQVAEPAIPGLVTIPAIRAALRDYPDGDFSKHVVNAEEVLKALDGARENDRMLLRVIENIGKAIGEHPEALWEDPSVAALALTDVAKAAWASGAGEQPGPEVRFDDLIARVVAERAARS